MKVLVIELVPNHEDAFVISELYLTASCVVALDESLYCYRKREGGISTHLRPLNQIRDDLNAGGGNDCRCAFTSL